MTDFETVARIDAGVETSLTLQAGQLEIHDQVHADLQVQTPGRTPLSARETHLALRVDAEDASVVLDLDAAARDALAAALADTQEGE